MTFLFAQTASECLGVFFLEQLDIVVFVTPQKKLSKICLQKTKDTGYNFVSEQMVFTFSGPQPQILFDEITPFSVVIALKYQDNIGKEHIDGCKVWHRSAKVLNYSSEPTCHILRPNTRSLVSGLSPSAEYFFKVLPFGSIQEFTEREAKCTTRSLDHGSSQC